MLTDAIIGLVFMALFTLGLIGWMLLPWAFIL